MNEIFKTKFVSLLSDTSVVANEEMQNAYVDFVVQVGTLSQSEPDYEKSNSEIESYPHRVGFVRVSTSLRAGGKMP